MQLSRNSVYLNRFVKSSFFSFLLLVASFCHAQLVINEVMVRPQFDSTSRQDQSLVYCGDTSFGAEWIEIYNRSQCDTIDLECYILGSRTADSNYAAFAFPAGSRLLPLTFAVVGGKRAPGVDFALPDFCFMGNLCGPGQWWLPDDYGWVALYKSGSVVDAVFWTALPGQAGQLASNPAFAEAPCPPSSCQQDSLTPAKQMAPGTEILYAGKAPAFGLSIYRQTDGNAPWQTDGLPTPGQCNGPCAPPTDLMIQIINYENETCLQSNGWAQAAVSGGAGPYDLDWSNTANGDSIFGLEAGAYSVTVTDADDCIKATSVTLINIGTPVTVTVTPPQPVIFKGESVQITLTASSPLDSINWLPVNDLSCSDCSSPIASPPVITTYVVQVSDTDGCTGNASVTVKVISDENSTFIPTAFTPNADNLNDLLFVRSSKLVSLDFHIYDRWGNEVFATTDPNVGWDGTDKKGNEVDAGIYVYYAVITFDNGKSKMLKGNVGVIR